MLDRVRNILRRLYIDDLARELWRTTNRILVTFKRKFGRLDRELIDKYVSAEEVRKLHIGCGEKIIDGWLNADFSPSSPTVLHLDAIKGFCLRRHRSSPLDCESRSAGIRSVH